MTQKRIALVTGGNRGIGLEICRQLASQEGIHVLMGSREEAKGKVAAVNLAKQGLHVDVIELDVSSETSIQKAAETIKKKYKRLDILINNAGVFVGSEGDSVLDSKLSDIKQTMSTNIYGPLLLAQAFANEFKASPSGRIINMSSGLGQLEDMGGGYTAYRLSKTALNALTRILAAELPGVMVNAMCPGWVQTDMGGANATRTVDQGADTAVWLATLSDDKHLTGSFFRDRQRIPW